MRCGRQQTGGMKTNPAIKPRRTQGDISKLLIRYHQSGQTVQAFSDSEGVASSSVYKWLRRERSGGQVRGLVEVTPAARPRMGFVVGTPHGYRIEVPGDFSPEELKRLLGALEA